MEKFDNDYNLEDILSSLDDENVEEIDKEDNLDLEDILSDLDEEPKQEEPVISSFNDYASKLIKELEDELKEDNDNLSSLSSMVDLEDESNKNSDDILPNEEDDLVGILSELDEEEQEVGEEESIEDLFNQFIEAVKNLGKAQKDVIVDKLKEEEK